jgi:hypothetical protein
MISAVIVAESTEFIVEDEPPPKIERVKWRVDAD